MARILVVDDDPRLVITLTRALSGLGHDVRAATTGQQALAELADQRPEMVLLDDRLPDLSGLTVLERLRSWSETPVLFVAGGASQQRRVAALDAGADDFIDKPFLLEELRARIDATLRRVVSLTEAGAEPTVVAQDDVTIDLATRRVSARDRQVHLTPLEWRLLGALLAEPGAVLPHERLITTIWSGDHGEEAKASLRVHVRSLRRKLGDSATTPRFVETVAGSGYRWVGAPMGPRR